MKWTCYSKEKKNLPIFVATVRFHFVSELQDYQLWCSIKKTEPQKDTLNRLLDNTLFSNFTSVRGQLFFTDFNHLEIIYLFLNVCYIGEGIPDSCRSLGGIGRDWGRWGREETLPCTLYYRGPREGDVPLLAEHTLSPRDRDGILISCQQPQWWGDE